MQPRFICDIAADIKANWPKVNYAAAPYLEVMEGLGTIEDVYFHDDARNIVIRFLSNATSWRGPEARRIKAELKAML